MSYQGKREQTSGRAKKYGKALTIMAVVMVLSCFAGGIFARYMRQEVLENNQVEAESFYFTVDLIRDDTLTNVEKEFALYGGGDKTIKFNVWNYVDDLRITNTPVSYTIAVSDNNLTYAMKCGETPLTLKEEGGKYITDPQSFEKSIKTAQQYTLDLSGDYKNNTVVTVEVTSTAPYAKTITLKFRLYNSDADMLYRVEDETTSAMPSNTAKLIVMANRKIDAGKILLDLSGLNASENAFMPDMTDVDIWTWEDGTPKTPPAVPAGEAFLKSNVPITVDMEAGESLEIIFFKKYPAKNYQTIAPDNEEGNIPLMQAGGNYTIPFAEYTVGSGS